MQMFTRDKDGRPVAGHLQTGEVAEDRDVSKHRRRIIRASAAVVPAIMTLRSGAAAAMVSSYQCFTHGEDASNVDRVLGDEEGDPPHDEWTRMDAKPVYCITGNNSKKYYALRKERTAYAWDEVEGWDWYPPNFVKNEKIISDPADIVANDNIISGWVNRVAVYCVPADPTGWNCIDERGVFISTPLAPFVIPDADIEACKVTVKLLVYYDPVTGYMSYYPMKGEIAGALPITGSCMCSISPTYQL
jgi:hypothetical protein